MILYGTFANQYGHHVMRFEDSKVTTFATCGSDAKAAERIVWLLDREDRLHELWRMHGDISVPLENLP